MAKIADVQEVSLDLLKPYANNAKIHGQAQIEKIKDSIQAFGFISPCLIDEDYNIIAGHGRLEAAKQLGMETIPCVFIEGLSETERKAYILADNRLTELGDWDMSIVDAELAELEDADFDIDLTGFDSSDWFDDRERWDMSREEGNEEYNEFLEKFETKKTTDDCYTPDNVYDAIVEYIEKRYNIKREDFVRPFYPDGDYQNEEYKETDIIVDNPPFSILAEIVDFYVSKNQRFFLFAPGLSTLAYTNRKNVAAICLYAPVTYENGANVPTSFITNLEDPQVCAVTLPDLYKTLSEINDENLRKLHTEMPKYEYPVELATAAKLGYLSKYGQALTLKRIDTYFVRCLDAQKEHDKAVYGNGFLLSEKAAAEKAAAEKAAAEKAAAEKAAAEKAAAEKAAAMVWQLSDREKAIIKSLGEGTSVGENDTPRTSKQNT